MFQSAGGFLVGHRAADLRPERSLERLYLDRLRALGEGGAGPDERRLTLVLDVKSGLPDGWRALDALLGNYASFLSQRVDTEWVENRVTVLVSHGGLARDVERRRLRFVAVEGRLGDLGLGVSPSLMPQVAADWRKWFSWKTGRSFPDSSRRRLVALVRRVHGEGRRLRFWNTPDDSTAWGVLIDAGVDVIGTDDLPKLRAFIAARAEPAHRRP